MGLCRKKGESLYNCIDRKDKEQFGLVLTISDAVGYYGIASAAIGLGSSALASLGSKVAQEGIDRATLIGVEKAGNLGARITAARATAGAAGRIAALKATLTTVSKVTGTIGFIGTGVSVGSRAVFIPSCSKSCNEDPCE